MAIIPRLLSSGSSDSALPRSSAETIHVTRGPLLTELESQAGFTLEEYRAAGGYRLAAAIATAEDTEAFLLELDRAGVRGRAGGGYPTAHKWYLVSRKEGESKYFVCNANAHPGDLKVPYLLGASPHKLIEAVAAAALLSGASTAYLAVPGWHSQLVQLLRGALDEVREAGLLGAGAFGGRRSLEVQMFEIPDVYIAGEETALLEAIEGRAPRPRGKTPLPTSQGLFGSPTAVSNLETVLQAFLALRGGADAYRRWGTDTAPGTMIFELQGDVERPGLYELPLGTSLRDLVFGHGGGSGQREIKLIFPGGLSSAPVGADALDLALDYDSLRDAATDLGSGSVIVVSSEVAAPDLATELAAFFHHASCGKCRPCKDGTQRTLTMLGRLGELDKKSIDLVGRSMPAPKRRYALQILGQAPVTAPTGISYTDMTDGLAKISELCEFYKFRGDCHHSTEAASVIQRLIELFRPEFEERANPSAASYTESETTAVAAVTG